MNAPIKTDIPARERLIFALDVPDLAHARSLIDTLGDAVVFYKLGLEFFLSGHYFELAADLKASGKKIFADLKLFDIPATVASAVRQLARHDVDFCTVHGNDAMLKAAAEAKGGEFIFNAEVADVRSRDNQVLGVTLKDGTQYDAPVVVNAAGPHSYKINQMA